LLTRFRVAALVVLITAFVPPKPLTPYPYAIVPAIGLFALFWGVIWWGGMKVYMRWAGLKLVVSRRPYIQQEEENGEWTVKYEIVKHRWIADTGANDSESDEEDVIL
jgi:hypothetical protein